MKTIQKSLMTASLLLAGVTASAQSELLEALPEMLQKEFSIEPKKSLNQERDVLKEGCPLKSRCDIYSFTLTKKQQEKVFKGLKDCFESAGKDKNCYSVNSMNDLPGKESLRNLIIGDDVQHYVTIGQDYTNYINVNILDAKDTTKTHRYAYALEWRETSETSEKGAIDVRYIITYAKIPDPYQTSPRVSYQASLSSSLADEVKDMIKNGRELWGRDFAFDELQSEDNILLTFSKLKDQYFLGINREFNAISIYLLCKRVRAYGYFKGEDSKAILKQLKDEVRELVNTGSNDKAVLYYLQQALLELEQIK